MEGLTEYVPLNYLMILEPLEIRVVSGNTFNFADSHAIWQEYGLEGTLELFQFFSEENCDYPSKEGGLKVSIALFFYCIMDKCFAHCQAWWRLLRSFIRIPFSLLMAMHVEYLWKIQLFLLAFAVLL